MSSPIVDLVAKADIHGLETAALCRHFKCSPQDIGDEIERLKEAGRIVGFAGVWIVPEALERLDEKVVIVLDELHAANPGEPLFEPEVVAKRAGLLWTAKSASRLLSRLAEKGVVRTRQNRYGLPGRSVEMKPPTRVLLDRLKRELDRASLGAATPITLARELGVPPQAVDQVLDIGANAAELRELAPGFWITTERLSHIRADIRGKFGSDVPTVSQLRDHLSTSRRIAHAILEA